MGFVAGVEDPRLSHRGKALLEGTPPAGLGGRRKEQQAREAVAGSRGRRRLGRARARGLAEGSRKDFAAVVVDEDSLAEVGVAVCSSDRLAGRGRQRQRAAIGQPNPSISQPSHYIQNGGSPSSALTWP